MNRVWWSDPDLRNALRGRPWAPRWRRFEIEPMTGWEVLGRRFKSWVTRACPTCTQRKGRHKCSCSQLRSRHRLQGRRDSGLD